MEKSMGLVPHYNGRTPGAKGAQDAHRDLAPILSGHLDRRIVILKQVLKDFHFSEPAIKAWVDFENAFRKPILSRSLDGKGS